MGKYEIWTIGHSTRSFSEFLELLKKNRIETLVDVRSMPGSRKFPYFDREQLELHLPEHGIRYVHSDGLGGRRKGKKDSVHTAWRNASFRAYADYMETDGFKKALEDLKSLAGESSVCMMCSEAVWWRCHRSMISDILKVQKWQVWHILSTTKVEAHPYTSAAVIKDGCLIYHN